jgi:hypothetical protein
MMYYEEQTGQNSITIRLATAEDDDRVRRLAQRDTRPVPDGDLLIALVDDTPRAAVSLVSGEAIADPFHRTDELVRILQLQRLELRRGAPHAARPRRLLGPLVTAPARAGAADASRSAAC